MSRTGRVVGTTALVVVLATGGYATADAYGLAPGPLTLAPEPHQPAPFPTAPGAVVPSAAATALAALDPNAAVPDDAKVQQLVDAMVADPRLGPTVGVLVADQLTGAVVASHLPDDPRTPASTQKLVMGAAALSALGPDTTLATKAVAGPGGSVVLVGGGDMMLAPGAGTPTAVDGHAGLGDLAAQVARKLKLEGRTSVSLGVDDTLFSGPGINPAWDPDGVAAGYVAPVSALAVDIAKTRAGEYMPRYPDPAMQAAKTFAAALAAQGITVTSVARATAPADGRPLGEVRSAPVSEILQYTLEESDNTIAEVLARLVAVHEGLPATFDGGAQADLRVLDRLGVDTSGARLVDASGLGAGSVVPPRLLVDLLRVVTDPGHAVLRPIAAGMPIAGLTGTLFDRFTQSDARGQVRAKTGSLPGVTSLAGTVLDDDGRQLVFAVIADQTPGPGQDAARRPIDAFVSALAGCGCR